jgi:hypothetical protein
MTITSVVKAALSALPVEALREIAVNPEADEVVPQTSLGDLLARGVPEAVLCVEDAARSWCAAQTDARHALREVTQWDRRLGTWLACQVARTTLRLMPDCHRAAALAAIETTERWVRAEATTDEVFRAADAVGIAEDNPPARGATNAWLCIRAAARMPIFSDINAVRTASSCADDAARALQTAVVVADYGEAEAVRTRILREICTVIVGSIHGAVDAIRDAESYA